MKYTEIGLLVILFLNIYVSFKVWRKEEFNRFQKISQSIIIWLLPVIGALGIWAFIRSDENPRGPYNPNDGQGNDSVPGGVQ